MPKMSYRELAEQSMRETVAYYAVNPLPASHKFAFNPKNQRYLNNDRSYKKSNGRNKFVSFVVAVTIVVATVCWAYSALELEITLAREGVAGQATIVEKYSTSKSGSRSRPNYYLTYELAYRDANGNPQTVQKSEGVSSVFYNSQKVGSTVQVIYSPKTPNNIKLANNRNDLESAFLALLVAGPICLVVAVITGIQIFRHARKRRQLKRGQLLTGFVSSKEIKQNRAGKPTSVTVNYRFTGPQGQPLTGQAAFPAKYFKSRWHIVEDQKPLVVLYRDETHYEVL